MGGSCHWSMSPGRWAGSLGVVGGACDLQGFHKFRAWPGHRVGGGSTLRVALGALALCRELLFTLQPSGTILEGNCLSRPQGCNERLKFGIGVSWANFWPSLIRTEGPRGSHSLSFCYPGERRSLVSARDLGSLLREGFGGKARPPLVSKSTIWRLWDYFCL